MNASIRDKVALSKLMVSNLHAYARSRNWNEQETWNDRAIVYTQQNAQDEFELLVPLRDTFADYAERVANILYTLSKAEDRSEEAVYLDLIEISADVIRFWSSFRPAEDTVSLAEYSNLYTNANDMLSAAARAVETPRAAYRGKISSYIAEYLSQVTPIMTTVQGYSLTLHSPVTQPLYEQRRFLDYSEEQSCLPFSRRATLKLAEALDHVTDALSYVYKTDDLSPFEEAVSHGVSANLCSSISRVAKDSGGLAIGLYWASIRGSELPRQYSFRPSSVDILEDAAKELRDTEPFLNHTLLAYVVRLEREPHEFDGKASILTNIDGASRRLHVEFKESDFSQVIGAFKDHQQIELVGDVRKKGPSLIVENPRHLKVVED